MNIHPIILCGGSGTRLWPVSRKAMPKQFVPLVGEESLFVATLKRMAKLGYRAPTVVTGHDYRFVVRDQLDQAGQSAACILIEPEGRNTAPAILAAVLQASEPADALFLVAPSDHLVTDVGLFGQAVSKGAEAALAGSLVTFGIRPTRPETGYGYLHLENASADGQPVALRGFVEKPDHDRAETMLADGCYLWNAGLFLFRRDALIEAYQRYAPDMVETVSDAVTSSRQDLEFQRLDEKAWSRVENISIDYAIMEKADTIQAVSYEGDWSDLGDWEALWRQAQTDERADVTLGAATAIDCSNSYIRSESDDLEVVGIGLRDTLVVATPDAVLVADKSRAQDVKQAVEQLSATGAKQADRFPRDHRPWGWYDVLALSDRFQVKRIVVKPGAALSLQSHVHRSEHWIVVSGTARVTLDDAVRLISENQSIYIPLGAKHRLENPGKLPMVLIEVQTGSYLGEDDIVRYDDVYARS